MTQLTEIYAYNEAVLSVVDQICKTTTIEGDDASVLGMGFVSGMLHGLRKGSMGSLIAQGPTADAFWRGNWDEALAFERANILTREPTA